MTPFKLLLKMGVLSNARPGDTWRCLAEPQKPTRMDVQECLWAIIFSTVPCPFCKSLWQIHAYS